MVSRTDTLQFQSQDGFQQAPSLEEIALGLGLLQLGQFGFAVWAMQQALNGAGVFPPLKTDGQFGPTTQGALTEWQEANRLIAEIGVMGLLTLARLRSHMPNNDQFSRAQGFGPRCSHRSRLRAPHSNAGAPRGSVSAGSLQRADESRMRMRTRSRTPSTTPRPVNPGITPSRVAPTSPALGLTGADGELQSLQQRTITSAQRELDAGVREDGGRNRGQRVDQYARRSNMRVGGEWCGYFTGFNYSEAAREAGGEFTGINGFHSMQKARSFFEYRSYTNNSRSTNDRLDRLREEHQASGSTRRWMTLSGSGGQQHASARNRPHEVFEPNNLPIRAGDTAVFSRGHLGLVESYNRDSGQLTTIEGNTTGGRVRRRTYNLNDSSDRAKFEGFGRPARGDFSSPSATTNDAPTTPAANAPNPSAPEDTPDNAPNAPSTPSTPEDATNTPEDAPKTAPTEKTKVGKEASPAPAGAPRINLPARPEGAMTGSEFLERTKGLSRADREKAILAEIEQGNVPEFSRQMRPVQVSTTSKDGTRREGTFYAAPDYLAIGSDDDFVRIPMNPLTAQKIADRTGTSLPTRKMVDDIYSQSSVQMTPQPIPPSSRMMSNAYYGRHAEMVESQRRERGADLGELTSGHKKDVVLTNRLDQRPDRVAIYGWHQQNGEAIQPLSTIHENTYADYSHGVRLIGGTMMVDGQARPVSEVLQDPELAGLLSDEGAIRNPRVPGVD